MRKTLMYDVLILRLVQEEEANEQTSQEVDDQGK